RFEIFVHASPQNPNSPESQCLRRASHSVNLLSDGLEKCLAQFMDCLALVERKDDIHTVELHRERQKVKLLEEALNVLTRENSLAIKPGGSSTGENGSSLNMIPEEEDGPIFYECSPPGKR
ncbi:unnamed protein product, partial [Cyprideis torosa]